MATYTQEEIDENYRKLPETLRDQLMSAENAEHIFEVGKKFGLTIEQTGFLAEESGFVVLGLTHPKDFVPHLSERLRIDIEKTKAITQEINHHVFFPLREMLKRVHQFELTQEQIQTPLPPLPPISRPAERVNIPSQQSMSAPIQKPMPEIIQKKPIMPPPAVFPPVPANTPSNAPASPPPPINIAEILNTKELAMPSPSVSADIPVEKKESIPLAPSQILQQKLAEEQKKPPLAGIPVNAPAQSLPPTTTQAPPSTPLTQTPPRTGHDPYREPIE